MSVSYRKGSKKIESNKKPEIILQIESLKGINNLDKVYQEIPTEQENVREYTQDKDTLDNVKLADRLDPNMLDPFRENPYTQSLSSFIY